VKTLVYIKKVVVDQKDLAVAVDALRRWRGPRSGRPFEMISIYFSDHKKHREQGLASDKMLIIARS